ncbi:hypothetical protein QUF63_01900 [Anaerolineales bacterium HSG25]|nr:hypothetical protein [Anaerolineales bacterium HSG25]
MDSIKMLHNMCHYTLSNVDTKAICKVRGFSTREAGTPALFENFFLSDMGLKETFALLSQDEIILLHLLNQYENAVDISFFKPLYDPKKTTNSWEYHRTFTQRHQKTFKAVKTKLVRCGVLIIAEEPAFAYSDKTKMERWLFRFPKEFAPYLPPLFAEPYKSTRLGKQTDEALRQIITNIPNPIKTTSTSTAPLIVNDNYRLHIIQGTLQNGNKEFRASHLQEWQQLSWKTEIDRIANLAKHEYLQFGDILTYAFSQLSAHQWLSVKHFARVIRISLDLVKKDDIQQICETGYKLGLLKRLMVDKPYYRLPDSSAKTKRMEPTGYLSKTNTGQVRVDLRFIPYDDLEQIARISKLRVANDELLATPSLIKFGRAPVTVQEHPTIQWLNQNMPAYTKITTALKKEWGKHIIHKNLLVAQVNDLSLKVQLERKFSKLDDFLFLPNDFIAFPKGYRTQVEKVVAKSGHVVNQIKAGK